MYITLYYSGYCIFYSYNYFCSFYCFKHIWCSQYL